MTHHRPPHPHLRLRHRKRRRQQARLLRKGLAGHRPSQIRLGRPRQNLRPRQHLRPLVTVRLQLRRPVHPPQMLRRRLPEARLHPHPPAPELTVLRRQPKARR